MIVSKQEKIHFKALDAFRGLAAVMIVLYHSQFFADDQPNRFIQNSGVFVDFFFVLSGFVMAYSYMDRMSGGIGFKKFIVYRFARLYPLHLFTLLVWVPYILVKIYLYDKGVGSTDASIDNNLFTFAQNLLLLQGFGLTVSWNYPSWSIGTEFYTYILFYAVIFFSLGWSRILRMALIVLVILAAYWSMENHKGDVVAWWNMFRCLREFLLGVLVYYLYKEFPVRITNVLMATFLETVLLASMVYLVYHLEEDSYFGYHYAILIFMGIIYLFAVEKSGLFSRVLQFPFFQYLGKISYSIYMTHAIIVTGVYNISVSLLDAQTGNVVGVPTGIILPYADYLNIVFVLVVVSVSGWTYKHIEISGQNYIKKRFFK